MAERRRKLIAELALAKHVPTATLFLDIARAGASWLTVIAFTLYAVGSRRFLPITVTGYPQNACHCNYRVSLKGGRPVLYSASDCGREFVHAKSELLKFGAQFCLAEWLGQSR